MIRLQPNNFSIRHICLIASFFLSITTHGQSNPANFVVSINDLRQNAHNYLNSDDYDSAFVSYTQMLLAATMMNEAESIIEAEIGKTFTSYLNNKYPEADSLITLTAKALSTHTLHDSAILAPLYFVQAAFQMKERDYSGATKQSQKAIQLIKNSAHPDTSLLGRVHNLSGICYFRLNDTENSFSQYNQARMLVSAYSKRNYNHIVKYTQNIGMLYASQGNYDEAIPYFQQSLKLKKLHGIAPSRTDITYNNNFGRIYYNRQQYSQAAEHYNEAIRIATELYGSEYELLGDVYINQGNIYTKMADYTKAREYYQKALALINKYNNSNDQRIQLLYNNIGYTHQRQEDYESAIKNYLQVIKGNSNYLNLVKAYRNSGQCYYALNQLERAEECFTSAIAIAKKINPIDELELAYSFQDYGDFLVETKKDIKGIEFLNNSLSILERQENQNGSDAAYVHTILGNFYSKQPEMLLTALSHFQCALKAQESKFTSDNIEDNPDIALSESPYELLGILAKKGDVLFKLYEKTSQDNYLLASATAFNLAIRLFDELKTNYSYDESKLFISGQSNFIFQQALRVAYKLYEQTGDVAYLSNAFYYSEKTKYSTLLEAYREAVLRNETVPKSIVDKQIRIKEALEEKNRTLYALKQKDTTKLLNTDVLNAAIFDLNREYDSIQDEIKNMSPDYFYANYSSNIISPDKIQHKLSKNQVLIEYSLQDTLLYSFFISKHDFIVNSTTINTHYIDSLRQSISDQGLANFTLKDYNCFVNASYYLYGKYIEPIKLHLKNKSIIIIPDGKSGYIPFEALLTSYPQSKRMDFRTLNYLILDNPISYAYSSTILFEKRNKSHLFHKNRLIAFAPDYSNMEENASQDSIVSRLLPIPGVTAEVNAISKYFKGKILTGEEATEESFKRYAPEYDILHLAMHTLINDKNPIYSKLVFTPTSLPNSNEGLLYTSELFTMTMKARMAVLSACQTGYGDIKEGEGILSLARGFFYAGVPSVIMTLWSVEDVSSTEIMTSFYSNLKKGMRKDDALREAKLKFLKKQDPIATHPRFWAGYVTIGQQDPIINKKIYFLIPAILLLFIIITLIRRK